MNTEAEDLASRLRIVEALARWNAVTKGVNAVSNDDERAERIFGHEMKALERVFGLLNAETIFRKPEEPKPSNVIPLRRTPNHAGEDTINARWDELQRQAVAEYRARIDAMTPEELDAHYRSERARQAMLDAGMEP